MPNIKSQIKRVTTNDKARSRNAAFKSRVRTAIKKVNVAIAAQDKENAQALYLEAVKLIDRSVSKGVFHVNKAARYKSRLNAHVVAINK